MIIITANIVIKVYTLIKKLYGRKGHHAFEAFFGSLRLPIFFITLFEKDGLTFEKYFKYIYLHKFYQPQKRVRKEVYLEQQKKNSAAKAHAKRKGVKKGETGIKAR